MLFLAVEPWFCKRCSCVVAAENKSAVVFTALLFFPENIPGKNANTSHKEFVVTGSEVCRLPFARSCPLALLESDAVSSDLDMPLLEMARKSVRLCLGRTNIALVGSPEILCLRVCQVPS